MNLRQKLDRLVRQNRNGPCKVSGQNHNAAMKMAVYESHGVFK